MPMNEHDLQARDVKRDLGAELLASVREMKAGKAGRVHHVPVHEAAQARANAGMTQSQFAKVLGVSTRTLQEWEQGRRKPSGAAQSLLTIAVKRPEIIRELFEA